MARRRIKGKAKRGGSYGGGCGGFASSSQAQAMALAHSQGSSTSGLASSIAFTLVQGIELASWWIRSAMAMAVEPFFSPEH